jgi:predicted RNA-binding Zn-ribbon protein involved in translation (DUF1610 family)
VKKHKLRRLYESDAAGLLDEELLDDVGLSLVLRCRSILAVHQAQQGRVACPQCELAGTESIIRRERGRGDPNDQELACPACGWRTTWGEYASSFRRHQLNAGGAVAAFEAYARDYPAARTPQARMLAIDALIHAFHYSLRDRPDLPTRPAGVNLIEGRLTDVVQFLEELTFGSGSTPGLRETRERWDGELARTREFYAQCSAGSQPAVAVARAPSPPSP